MTLKSIIILFVIIVLLSVGVIWPDLARSSAKTKVTMAVSYDPSSASIFVAHDKGFFTREGLDLTLLMHQTGKAALASTLQGKADFATIADTVLMFAALDNQPISAIATISDSNSHHKVIALRSRGIAEARDLTGKRIGVTSGTSGDFFLYSFLLFKDIPVNRVRIVNLSPDDMHDALVSRKVDAVAAWYPTVDYLRNRLGADAIIFGDEAYSMTWNIVAEREYLSKNPETVKKILRALLKAQVYLFEHPEEAIKITARHSRIDPGQLKSQWKNYEFNIRLGEGLLVNLEDQARWALRNSRGRITIPDFKDFIYTRGLEEVKPSAISIRGKGIKR